MKRLTQTTGVRKYFGGDFIDLQAEGLRVIDGFFAEYGSCVIEGVKVTPHVAPTITPTEAKEQEQVQSQSQSQSPAENGTATDRTVTDSIVTDGLYDVSAGLVALEVEDALTLERGIKVMPFAGVQGVTLPIYLSAQVVTETRAYGDGKVKPVAYNYTAVATATPPTTEPTTQERTNAEPTIAEPTLTLTPTPHLVIDRDSVFRFVDAVQDEGHRFLSDAERVKWDATLGRAREYAKDYADVVQAEAHAYTDTAQAEAEQHAREYTESYTQDYADGKDTVLRNDMNIADVQTLNNAKTYADIVVSALVDTAPETLNTLQEIATALGDDPNFATTVMTEIGKKVATTDFNEALENKADTVHNHERLTLGASIYGRGLNSYQHSDFSAFFGWNVPAAPFGGDLLGLTITNPRDSYARGFQLVCNGSGGSNLCFRWGNDGYNANENQRWGSWRTLHHSGNTPAPFCGRGVQSQARQDVDYAAGKQGAYAVSASVSSKGVFYINSGGSASGLQFEWSYGGDDLRFRKSIDSNRWNTHIGDSGWCTFYHSGNFDPSSKMDENKIIKGTVWAGNQVINETPGVSVSGGHDNVTIKYSFRCSDYIVSLTPSGSRTELWVASKGNSELRIDFEGNRPSFDFIIILP